ncbi:hypothetical protein F4861DRAFT_535846 [Xylaria intraflava]|nr:hypothetical protein F4861DRAFT_535846 [Xylaria intraflava]
MFVIGMAYVFGHFSVHIYSSPDREEFVQGLEAEYKEVELRPSSIKEIFCLSPS